MPYFENVNAIIFCTSLFSVLGVPSGFFRFELGADEHHIVAPLSCFDERLVEDSRINRLEDSFLLWRTVCSSKLLEKTSLILFMNKIDLLKKKIKVGFHSPSPFLVEGE